MAHVLLFITWFLILRKIYVTLTKLLTMFFQVSILAGADEKITDISYQYGRNLGLGFQLVDDLLDFVSSAEAMGKPTAADLKLGLATAPVLFACEKVRVKQTVYNVDLYIFNNMSSI